MLKFEKRGFSNMLCFEFRLWSSGGPNARSSLVYKGYLKAGGGVCVGMLLLDDSVKPPGVGVHRRVADGDTLRWERRRVEPSFVLDAARVTRFVAAGLSDVCIVVYIFLVFK